MMNNRRIGENIKNFQELSPGFFLKLFFSFDWLTNPSPRGSPSLYQGTQIGRVPVVLLDKGGGNPGVLREEGGFVNQSREFLNLNNFIPKFHILDLLIVRHRI
jgi:hypothetical protein